jgi:hypothetical protein
VKRSRLHDRSVVGPHQQTELSSITRDTTAAGLPTCKSFLYRIKPERTDLSLGRLEIIRHELLADPRDIDEVSEHLHPQINALLFGKVLA